MLFARVRLSLLWLVVASLFALDARADGKWDGKWSFSGIGESYTVQQWYKSCGTPPVGSGGGGGTVSVIGTGDELVFGNYRTDRCLDPMPTLQRVAHSRDAAGGSWRTSCVTPPGDPRRAIVQLTVTAVSDNRIVIQETGTYTITVQEGTCTANVNRAGTLNRVVDTSAPSASASATAAPTATTTAPPAPTVDCSSPGAPARLEVRPSRKLVRAGESFVFNASVLDAKGCPTQTATSWALDKVAAGQGSIDSMGRLTIPADASEGSFDVVVSAAGQSTRARVDVASSSDYDALLAQEGLDPNGERDEPSVAIITSGSLGGSQSRGVDGSSKRRLVFVGVVGGLAAILGALALVGVVRSRRASRIERDVEARHAERMEEFEARKRERETAHATQMKAHLESVKRAQEAAASGVATTGEMVCPSCRREYPEGSIFCPHDANRLIPLAGHEEVLTGPAGGICPTCKRGFNPGTKVCPHDGDELVPFAGAPRSEAAPVSRGKICPTCGGRFDGAASFCGKDGTALVLLN
jgi:hypothetical protein